MEPQWEEKKIMRYKARLVARGFSQRLGVDYEESHSLMVDAIIFRYLICLSVSKRLDIRLIDGNYIFV